MPELNNRYHFNNCPALDSQNLLPYYFLFLFRVVVCVDKCARQFYAFVIKVGNFNIR